MEVRPGRPHALVDTPDGVVVSGAPPNAPVRIETHLDLGGQAWRCAGEYVADQGGVVDTSTHSSSGGTYHGVDPFGLYWSAETPPWYDWDLPHPMRVTVRATCEDLVGDASFQRMLISNDVVVRDVAEDGVVGRLYVPASEGPLPAAVLLAGAVGGLGLPETAPLLASHGVVVLALAHWNHPGLSEGMAAIDVRVVARAGEWLRSRRTTLDVGPAVAGMARGGELALLAASLHPDVIGPVVSMSGSAVAWGAVGPGTSPAEPAWAHDGEPVAHLTRPEDEDWESALSDEAAVEAATIPLENATGPVLLMSGADDRTWPSARLHELGAARTRGGSGADVTVVAYPDAGHLACVPPGYPLASRFELPNGQVRELGGSRAGNHFARLDAWRRLLDLVGATR